MNQRRRLSRPGKRGFVGAAHCEKISSEDNSKRFYGLQRAKIVSITLQRTGAPQVAGLLRLE